MAETLNCILRRETGKSAARRLRARKMLPGIIYGHNTRNIPVEVGENDFLALWKNLQERQVLLELVIRDEQKNKESRVQGLLQDYQHDILTRRFLHLDFHQVKAREKVRISIPVEIRGEAPGVKKGGILDVVIREIEIEALPADLPGNVVIDVGRLEIGDAILVSEIELGEKVAVMTTADEPIVTVLSPRHAEPETTVEEEAEAAAEEKTEPEVISEKTAEERRTRKEEG